MNDRGRNIGAGNVKRQLRLHFLLEVIGEGRSVVGRHSYFIH